MNVATVSSKRQITFSKAELMRLGVNPQGKVVKYFENGALLMRPLTGTIVAQTGGSLSSYIPSNKRGKSLDAIMSATRENVARKLYKGL